MAFALAACSDSSPTGPHLSGGLEAGQAGRWPTAAPEDVGLDRDILNVLEGRIEAGDFGEISSLLVLRGGTLVYEQYHGDWGPHDLHRINSITKSVTSLLVGMVLGGAASGAQTLQQPLVEMYAEYAPVHQAESKTGITFEHALQMRTGFEWDELSVNYSEPTNPLVELVDSEDWLEYVMNLPVAYPAGTRFAYNSGVSMLLPGMLRKHLDQTPRSFAKERLFDPLGIETWEWREVPGGLVNGGWGLYFTPRDMAAIAQLVLQDGVWDGERIVPADWLAASRVAYTQFSDGTGYGYQWWLPLADGDLRPMAGWGYGGQFIVIVPSLDMVLVSTAENYEGGGLNPYILADFAYRMAGAPAP
jgi:CubicO group peptidase (beta-lactamase class C family)